MGTPRRGGAPALEPLTPREEEVLALIAEGCTNTEIADRLGIRFDTAKNHVHNILQKLDAPSREEAARWWRGQRSPARVHRWLPAFAWPSLWRSLGMVAAVASAVIVVAGITAATIVALRDGASGASEQAAPTERPTPPIDDSGAVSPGAGTGRLVFLEQDSIGGPGPDPWTLHVYDAEVGSVVTSIPVRYSGGPIHSAGLAGNDVIIADSDGVLRYQLDGTSEDLYDPPEGTSVNGMAVSPNGSRIAITESQGVTGGRLVVLDLATGETVFESPKGAATAAHEAFEAIDFRGYPSAVTWRADANEVVVAGAVGAELPPGLAVLAIEQSHLIRSLGNEISWISPGARYATRGTATPVCSNFDSPDLEVFDLANLSTAASVAYADQIITPVEWSPDGTLLAVRLESATRIGSDDTVCPFEPTGETTLAILDVARQHVQPIDESLIELRQDWYGDRAIWFECEGQPLAPRERVSGQLAGVCAESDQTGVLVLDGTSIADAHAVRVVGWIDAP